MTLEFLVTATAVLTAETGYVDPDVDTIKAAPNVESPATLTDGSDEICSLEEITKFYTNTSMN